MKITLTLKGPITATTFNHFLTFSKMKVKKMRYKTAQDHTDIIYVQIAQMNQHTFINNVCNDCYFFSLFASDENNNLINYINKNSQDWDFINNGPFYMKEFIISIKINGIFDVNINDNNPVFLELEFE